MGLIESEHLKTWITPLVQLIALVYKDQHVNTLERLLNLWLESSLSESSEDNESNTTPQNHLQEDNGCYSSSLLTSTEPNSTDDASDGNGGASATHKSLDSDKGTCGCKFYPRNCHKNQCQRSKTLGDYSRVSNKRVNTDHVHLQKPNSTRAYWIPTRSVSSEARSAEVAEFFLRIQTFWH